MKFKEGPEFIRAEELLPEALYENLILILSLSLMAGIGVKLGLELNQEISSGLTLHLASAGLYIYGRLLDSHSTLKGLRLFEEADRLGLEHPLKELNPLYDDRLSPQTFLRSPKHILDYVSAGIAALSPEIGFPLALASGLVALNNYRKVQRLALAIDIATSS